MTTLPLLLDQGNLFVELDDGLWLFDTAAPKSFGKFQTPPIAGKTFDIQPGFHQYTAEGISKSVGRPCCGMIGADIIGQFDHIFNLKKQSLTLSTAELTCDTNSIPFDDLKGIPILTACINGENYKMFFVTSASMSYLQDDVIATFPPAGRITDTHPTQGEFETETYEVPVLLHKTPLTIRFGRFPGNFGAALEMAKVHGLIGNQVLQGRTVGFFPRRRVLHL